MKYKCGDRFKVPDEWSMGHQNAQGMIVAVSKGRFHIKLTSGGRDDGPVTMIDRTAEEIDAQGFKKL